LFNTSDEKSYSTMCTWRYNSVHKAQHPFHQAMNFITHPSNDNEMDFTESSGLLRHANYSTLTDI